MQYSKKVIELFQHPKNMKEIKDADGVGKVGNPTCLPPHTVIHTNDSLKLISEIGGNMRVLSHDGLYNSVLRTTKRKYNGKLIGIKNKLGKTYLTPEHMVYAIKVPKTWWFSFYKNKKRFPFGWYHADELEKNDLIVYPILKEIVDRDYLTFNQESKKFDYKSIKIPKKIPLNNDFLRLAGYYLSEGSLRDRVTKTYVSFSFNINEKELVNDLIRIIKKVFGLEAKIKTKKAENAIVVEVNNVWFTRLFKSLFRVGAANKTIPHELMLLPPEKQRSLLYGLWKGDGYFNKNKPRAGYSTISRELCQQVKTLLLRQKIIPSIYVDKEKIIKSVKHRKAYRIHIGERKSLENLAKILEIDLKSNKATSVDSWFDENYLFIPITEIERIPYTGFVYNLEVENSRSYLTEALTVHNCGDLMWIYIKVGKNEEGKEYIKDIGVKTYGCVAAIASSSITTELVKGKTLEEAEKLTKDDIMKPLGGLPPIKVHCSLLSTDGLKAAIADYRKKKKK